MNTESIENKLIKKKQKIVELVKNNYLSFKYKTWSLIGVFFMLFGGIIWYILRVQSISSNDDQILLTFKDLTYFIVLILIGIEIALILIIKKEDVPALRRANTHMDEIRNGKNLIDSVNQYMYNIYLYYCYTLNFPEVKNLDNNDTEMISNELKKINQVYIKGNQSVYLISLVIIVLGITLFIFRLIQDWIFFIFTGSLYIAFIIGFIYNRHKLTKTIDKWIIFCEHWSDLGENLEKMIKKED